jgi:hypothetical protein
MTYIRESVRVTRYNYLIRKPANYVREYFRKNMGKMTDLERDPTTVGRRGFGTIIVHNAKSATICQMVHRSTDARIPKEFKDALLELRAQETSTVYQIVPRDSIPINPMWTDYQEFIRINPDIKLAEAFFQQ